MMVLCQEHVLSSEKLHRHKDHFMIQLNLEIDCFILIVQMYQLCVFE